MAEKKFGGTFLNANCGRSAKTCWFWYWYWSFWVRKSLIVVRREGRSDGLRVGFELSWKKMKDDSQDSRLKDGEVWNEK